MSGPRWSVCWGDLHILVGDSAGGGAQILPRRKCIGGDYRVGNRGVALALAAQKTLADLFGGLSIVMRGAVRVGDFCQIDGLTGTVEDIGTSSLSLRTLGRSVVSIPNSKVAEVNLENFAMRDQFWLHPVFTLRFDTPYSVLKAVLEKIDKLLLSHEDIEKNSARVRLIDLTSSGPKIEVFAYFRRPGADWAVFLGEQERRSWRDYARWKRLEAVWQLRLAWCRWGSEHVELRELGRGYRLVPVAVIEVG